MTRNEMSIASLFKVLLTFSGFGASVYLMAEILGFQKGTEALVSPTADGFAFVAHGPNFYEYLASRYLIIALSFFVVFLFSLFERRILRIVSISICSVLVIFGLWQIVNFKFLVLEIANFPYNEWIETSVKYDTAIGVSMAILCGIETYLIIFDGVNSKDSDNLSHESSIQDSS